MNISPHKTYLVINPGSRHGHGRRTGTTVCRLLQAAGEAFDCGETRSLDDAEHLAHHAATAGYGTVVAVGGDGTINRVISGLMRARSNGTRLGVLYAGTSPDFCRFHGLPTDPRGAVDVLCAGRARAIDVGRLRHNDGWGRERIDYFASSANIGLGAGVAARANRYRPRTGDFLGTLLASLRTIAGHRPRRVQLTLDGRALPPTSVMNITVGKNPYLASGLKLNLDMAASDGRLFVFALTGIGRRQLIAALPGLYSGRAAGDRRFLFTHAQRVQITPLDGKLQTEFDGDPAGWCPAELTVLPRAVALIGASG